MEIPIPRHTPDNPYKYTNLQLAQRTKALRDMARDYPNLPYGWLEMCYDFVENTHSDEVKEIINSKKWEGPGMFTECKNLELKD